MLNEKQINPPHICAYFTPWPGFPTSCFFFVLIELMWEVNVCFVYINGIVDHHCLNFLFMIVLNTNKIEYIIFLFHFRGISFSKRLHNKCDKWGIPYKDYYNYNLCNQCISPFKLWVRITLMARYTRYNIMW